MTDARRIATQIGSVALNSGHVQHSGQAGGMSDRHASIHSTSPQVLNEMIQYADEHQIMRTRDAIVNKVIMEKGEVKISFLINKEFFSKNLVYIRGVEMKFRLITKNML